MNENQFEKIYAQLECIIDLLGTRLQPQSLAEKVVGWVATGITIFGIIGIIDILKSWIGG